MSFVKIQNRNADRTLVVFSSIHTIPGRFRFERQLADVNANVIFLNCPNNSWYLQGVPGLGDTMSSARKALKQIINEQFPGTRLFSLGSSMGASGLIALTTGLDIHRSFAFCPEIDLFGEASFSRKHYAGAETSVRDLWCELKECENINIFYGEECEHDLHQLAKLRQRFPGLPTQTFAHQPHGVVEAIYLTEGMSGILSSLLDGTKLRPKIVEQGHISGSRRSCEALWRAYCAVHKPDAGIAAELKYLAETVDKTRSYYPLFLFWRARLTHNKEERLHLLEQARALAPYSLRIAHFYFREAESEIAKEQFKHTFTARFGQRYIDNPRAEMIRQI